jgi:hypothetical protein
MIYTYIWISHHNWKLIIGSGLYSGGNWIKRWLLQSESRNINPKIHVSRSTYDLEEHLQVAGRCPATMDCETTAKHLATGLVQPKHCYSCHGMDFFVPDPTTSSTGCWRFFWIRILKTGSTLNPMKKTKPHLFLGVLSFIGFALPGTAFDSVMTTRSSQSWMTRNYLGQYQESSVTFHGHNPVKLNPPRLKNMFATRLASVVSWNTHLLTSIHLLPIGAMTCCGGHSARSWDIVRPMDQQWFIHSSQFFFPL